MKKLTDKQIRDEYLGQHKSAKSVFGNNYRFSAKQRNIEFYIRRDLERVSSEVCTIKAEMERLGKLILKLEPEKDQLQRLYDIASTITEEDVNKEI